MELPPDAVTGPLPTGIDTNDFTPRLISLLSNSLVWRESRILRARFGLGTNDWRVLSVLAIRPGVTASEISDFVAMNKAIISKSVGVLSDRRLIVQLEDTGRSRQLFLTPEGAEMHDAMLPVSLRGQEIILGDLSDEEVTRLNELLRRLLARAPELQVEDSLAEAEAGSVSAETA
ncbi:MarR family winged helix-turn-helix transcriptional regulator [Modestobacter versicolor]|uniref:MarR family winged helix-turn-helix transcriptional regulator n=1 Tax=Modestobacter versicolor TaxID=429133 RepID=UPI0034DE0A5A